MCLQASPGLCVWLFRDLYRVRRQTVFFSLLLHVCELTAAEPCACGSFSCSEIDNCMQHLLFSFLSYQFFFRWDRYMCAVFVVDMF